MFFFSDGKVYLETDKGFVGVEIYSDKVLEVGGRLKRKLKGARAMSLSQIRLKFNVTADNPLLFGEAHEGKE